MLRSLRVAILMLMFFELGCKSVRSNEVQGTWLMKDSSRPMMPVELRKGQPKIVMDANGTFVASELPGLFYFPGHRAERLESGSGVWKLMSRDGEQQIQLNFQTIADWNKTNFPYGTQLNVSRGWSSVSLFYFIGDPDDGRMIEFEKK